METGSHLVEQGPHGGFQDDIGVGALAANDAVVTPTNQTKLQEEIGKAINASHVWKPPRKNEKSKQDISHHRHPCPPTINKKFFLK